jgi:hypothetical protein
MKLARPPKFFFLKCYLLFFFPLTLLRKQKQKSKNRSKKKHIEINKETGRDSERIIQGPRIRARNTCWLFVSCPCLVNATLSLSLSALTSRSVSSYKILSPSLSIFLTLSPSYLLLKSNLSFYPKLSKAFITKDSSSGGCCVTVKSPIMLFVCSKRK